MPRAAPGGHSRYSCKTRFVGETRLIPEQLRPVIRAAAKPRLDVVEIIAQTGFEAGRVEAGIVDQHFVRIDHEGKTDAGFVAQPLKRECSIPGKIAPWLARHLAAKVALGQECPDDVLGLVL